MMRGRPEPSEAIRAARRSLEGHHHLRIVGELTWSEEERVWAFPVEITIHSADESLVPHSTRWYFVLDPRYPWGDIELYPAKDGGIEKTFPHQDYNGSGDDKLPWRSGDLCLRAPGFSLGRSGLDPDPKGECERIHWYVDRAIEWLDRAARGSLVRDGDEFELPQWKSLPFTVGFFETQDSFASWQRSPVTLGQVELVTLGDANALVARRFLDDRGQAVFEPRWGRHIRESQDTRVGAWLRLPKVPVLAPYAAPMTWGELTASLTAIGLSAGELLQRALRPLRDGKRHVLLLGFPVPRRFGEIASQLHWQPIMLPELSYGTKPKKGFSSSDKGYWLGDQATVLGLKKPLTWLSGVNWTVDELGTRGQLAQELRRRDLCVIGAGALGSVLTEVLVRGGVHKGAVIDADTVSAGNLVRHSLTLEDVGLSKSERLCRRLNTLSPHADFVPLIARFPELDEAALRRSAECDTVLDCSGADDVLQALAEEARATDALYVSVALGRGARRLYVYCAKGRSFPVEEFRDAITPWLTRDADQFKDTTFPWEGVGCWHPVFPATADQVWLYAATAARRIETAAVDDAPLGLSVFELSPATGVAEEVAG